MTTGRFERRTSYIWYCYPVTEVRKFLFTGLLICDNSASKTQYHAVLTTPDKWRFVGCSEPWKVNVCISQYKSEATGRVFPGRIWRISSYDIWIVNKETWRLEAIKNKQNGKNYETYFFSNSNLAKKLIEMWLLLWYLWFSFSGRIALVLPEMMVLGVSIFLDIFLVKSVEM